jgi:aminoethylphosphonate catabolism LysR family transcriptional regulator
MKSINIALLRSFHYVALQGSFSRAARVMNVTQPTLSQQVKLLEQTYGLRLLERTGRGVQPTTLGKALFEVTHRLFEIEQEAAELLTGAKRLTSGRILIGADGPFHVVPLIRRFQQLHPGPEVNLSLGNSTAVLADLLSTKLDVVLVADLPGDSRLFAVPLRRDPVLALLPAGHALARRRALQLQDLSGELLIMREFGSVTRKVVERGFAEADLVPGRMMEIGSREAVREAVAAGIGIGFVSASETMPDPRVALLPIHGVRMDIDEYAVCLRERRNLATVKAFLQVAQDAAKLNQTGLPV